MKRAITLHEWPNESVFVINVGRVRPWLPARLARPKGMLRTSNELVPNLLHEDMARVLRNLLQEEMATRDLRTSLESLAELISQTKNLERIQRLLDAPPLQQRVHGASCLASTAARTSAR